MKLKRRLRKELTVIPMMLKGYSRSMCNTWYKLTRRDLRRYKSKYSRETIQDFHKKGYLCRSISRYGLLENPDCGYITDFDYLRLRPFNSSMSKWISDMLTTPRILKPFEEHFRQVYFSIVQRDGHQLFLRLGNEDREYTLDDIVQLLKEKKLLELRSAYWVSDRKRHRLSYYNERIYINKKRSSASELNKLLQKLDGNYVIADLVSTYYPFTPELSTDHSIEFWLANDTPDGAAVLSAVMNFYWTDPETGKRLEKDMLIDLATGTFEAPQGTLCVPDWENIKAQMLEICHAMKQLTYFSATIALQSEAPFVFLNFDARPTLPGIAFHQELNHYLKEKADAIRDHRVTLKQHWEAMKTRLFNRYVKKHCRPGIRPYMQKLWNRAVWSDFLHTKVSIPKKIWCWKHGFISYHSYQYSMTKENYKKFLSDYDYHWLNRINNDYQKWINDKTTYRYILEPFKDYVPRYYMALFKRGGKVNFACMWDCPEGISEDYEGMLTLLRREKKLAFKPSAGTHGDGFYCLAYEEDDTGRGTYLANGEAVTAEDLYAIIDARKSFYVLTEYLDMHSRLKEIYPNSVNTVRVMVINRNGYDPKIMQTYMRIGSSTTGFTDNVGYGGICVMMDKDTGELYQPETIKEHVYYPCPVHPDTGTPIDGLMPHWDLVKKTLPEICRYLPELEYLGFDVAITEAGFTILEINVHQDLHKVYEFTDEIMDFFRQKIARKKALTSK